MATSHSPAVLRHVRRIAFLHERTRMTDGELLDRFLTQRDEAAFEALMRRHGPMVLAVCRRVLPNPHDAEDAFQATFLVLVRKAASLKDRELVGNWLHGTAYRAALEARAARRRSRERQVNPMPEPEAPTTERWEDLRPFLDRELSRLPEKFRVPVVLCDLEGRTRREVARQLGIPEGTLSGRLTTARRKLARRLTRHGVLLSGAGLATVLSQSSVSACVPVPLAISTTKAVTAVAAGQATVAGIVSAKVAALTEGVVKTMPVTKLKSLTIVFVAAAVFGSGGTFLTYNALGAEQKPGREPVPGQALAGRDEGPKPTERTDGYLGVMLAGDEDTNRVIIHKVFPDSPAAKAGVKAGDVLLKVGEKRVTSPEEAIKLVQSWKPGDRVTIHFQRGGKEMEATVTLAKWPAEVKDVATTKEGKSGKDEKTRGYLGLIMRDDDDTGNVVIHDLAPDCPALKAGLKPEDILVKVGGKPAKSAAEVIEGLSGLKTGDKVTLRIKRDGKETDVTVTAAKRPADFGKM
jgi:RNA polymerase sigma factor (sigma-70 family)